MKSAKKNIDVQLPPMAALAIGLIGMGVAGKTNKGMGAKEGVKDGKEEEHSSDENARFESNPISEVDHLDHYHEESMASTLTSPFFQLKEVSSHESKPAPNWKDSFQEFLFNR